MEQEILIGFDRCGLTFSLVTVVVVVIPNSYLAHPNFALGPHDLLLCMAYPPHATCPLTLPS
jgi:hypothetical protein